MSYRIVHGFAFGTDTMDWSNQADAERAETLLEDIILTFRADEAAELHDLLLKAKEGEIDWDHPKLEALEDRCSQVMLDVTKDYMSSPDLGHNCWIYAIA